MALTIIGINEATRLITIATKRINKINPAEKFTIGVELKSNVLEIFKLITKPLIKTNKRPKIALAIPVIPLSKRKILITSFVLAPSDLNMPISLLFFFFYKEVTKASSKSPTTKLTALKITKTKEIKSIKVFTLSKTILVKSV